jgi:hypothetical protein
MTEAGLPVQELSGPARQRGQQHGEALRGLINENIERWSDSIGATGIDPTEFLRELESLQVTSALAAHAPELDEEIKGIAEGSRQPLQKILALNLLDEADWFLRKVKRDSRSRG